MKVWHFFVRLGSLFLLLLSMAFALRDGLRIDWWGSREIFWICGMVAFFVTVAYSHRVMAGAGLVLAAVFLIWLVGEKRAILADEAYRLAQHVLPMVNSYYRTNFLLEELPVAGDWCLFLLVLLLLAGFCVGAGVARPAWRWLCYLPLLVSFLPGLLLSYAPGMEAVLCLCLGLGLTLFLFRKGQSRAGRQAQACGAVLCVAVVIAAFFASVPASERLLARHDDLLDFQLSLEDQMLEVLEDDEGWDRLVWRAGLRQMSVEVTNEEPGLDSDVAFEITAEQVPEHAVYVKNFTGADYDHGTWNPPSEQKFNRFAKEQGMDPSEYGARLQNVFLDGAGRIWIHLMDHSGNLSPMPYFCEVPEQADVVGDSGYRMGQDEYELRGWLDADGTDGVAGVDSTDGIGSYFDGADEIGVDGVNGTDGTGGVEDTGLDADDAEEVDASDLSVGEDAAYAEYVRREYTALPAGQLARMREDPQGALHALENDCQYAFDLSPVPEDWDTIEYFLFQGHRGYCMHFASATTLLARMQGVPARYASGYLVLPQDFHENEDGTYTARVTGQRAHAWAEFYKDGKWHPVETTPPNYIAALEGSPQQDVARVVAGLDAAHGMENGDAGNDGMESGGAGSVGAENGNAESDDTENSGAGNRDAENIGAENDDAVNGGDAGAVRPQGQENPQNASDANGLPGQFGQSEEPQPEEQSGQNGEAPSQGQADQPSAQGQGWGARVAKIALLVLLCLFLLVALWKMWLWAWHAWWERKFWDADVRSGTMAIQRATFRLLEREGLRFSDAGDELDFAADVERAVTDLEPGEFKGFIEVARAARYGKPPVTEEMRQAQYGVYQKLRQWHQRRRKR